MIPAGRFVAKIDSSSTMLLAAAHFLRGRDLSGLGFVPASQLLARLVNVPPKALRQYVYIRGGRQEAVPPAWLRDLRAEALSAWVVGHYPPRRTYPAVMIGSSNGALIHLCAALRIPWLPQTLLVPVRRRSHLDPDDLKTDMNAFREPARQCLARNPELQIMQMHDPIQDRLMIQQMGYFRVKRLRLGEAYERFLTRSLPPGGTLIVADCTSAWPMTQVGARHFFQVGGYGGLEAAEYLSGSRRVARYLKAQAASRTAWDCPPADLVQPEAEWGFEPSLLDDLRSLAARRGWRVRRLVFRDPADVSPLIADCYRAWYAERGVPPTRLFAESFLLLDPWWCLRTGSIPFWMVFNTGRSADSLRRYLRRRGPFEELYLTLFANSVPGIDQTKIQEWQRLVRRARSRGAFIGVDEVSYPYDLGVYFKFHVELRQRITARLPLPRPLTLDRWERFLAQRRFDRRVRWVADRVGRAPDNAIVTPKLSSRHVAAVSSLTALQDDPAPEPKEAHAMTTSRFAWIGLAALVAAAGPIAGFAAQPDYPASKAMQMEDRFQQQREAFETTARMQKTKLDERLGREKEALERRWAVLRTKAKDDAARERFETALQRERAAFELRAETRRQALAERTERTRNKIEAKIASRRAGS